MELRFSQALSHPPARVYTTMRERLPELAAYLEGVESITVLERRQLGPRVERVIAGMVTANLAGLARGLQRFLDDGR